MNATGKRRLLKLAEFLENEVEAKRFNMGRWGSGNEEGTPRCGTVACALGWASAVPSLRRAGVRLNRWGFNEPWRISKTVFDTSPEEFNAIFQPIDAYSLRGERGIAIVAERIRALVASEKARAA